MITLFVICLIIGIILLQLFMAKRQLRQLTYDARYDRELIEPGETMTVTARVRNIGRLPVFFAVLAHYIPDQLVIRNRKSGAGETVSSRLGETRISSRVLLLPHRMLTVQLELTAMQRGRYFLGKYYLEAGDYLGLRSETVSGELKQPVVVMPSRSEDLEAFQTLAGYLGDLSVRRFLFEDPVLTVGTRDYTGREPMKAIAWNQTARTGRMQVNLYDHTVETDVTVILNYEHGTPEMLEECLRLTRSVCERLEQDRISYEFFTNGDIRTRFEDLRHLPSGLGERHYHAIMYGCGQSNLHLETPFSWLIDQISRTRKANHGYVLITPPLNSELQAEAARLREFSDCDICVLTPGNNGNGDEAL